MPNDCRTCAHSSEAPQGWHYCGGPFFTPPVDRWQQSVRWGEDLLPEGDDHDDCPRWRDKGGSSDE